MKSLVYVALAAWAAEREFAVKWAMNNTVGLLPNTEGMQRDWRKRSVYPQCSDNDEREMHPAVIKDLRMCR